MNSSQIQEFDCVNSGIYTYLINSLYAKNKGLTKQQQQEKISKMNHFKLLISLIILIGITAKSYSNNYKKIEKEYDLCTNVKDKKRIAKKYLDLAKKENNIIEIRKGYKLLANSIEELTSIESVKYADSMILLSKKINKDLLLKDYVFKGILLSGLEKTDEALNLFFKVERETNDLNLKYNSKLMIAQLRMDDFLEIDESISMLKECETYFKNKNIKSYIITINSLTEAYLFSKKYKLARDYAKIGLKTDNVFF